MNTDWWEHSTSRAQPIAANPDYRMATAYWKFSHAPRDDWSEAHDYADWVQDQGEDLEQQRVLAELDFQTATRRPSEFEGKQQQALYYGMIAQIDDQLERILDCLEETRQRDNTVIILTSDHGEMLGDHGLLYKGCRYYEGLVRVPLIFSWKKIPGNFTTFGSIRTMPASRPSWLMPALTPPCWPQ